MYQSCSNCTFRIDRCVCAQILPINNHPFVLIIRHYKESLRGSNTARILGLGLQHCQIIDYSHPTIAFPDLDLEGAALLFPIDYGDATQSNQIYRDANPPKKIIIVDGTWRQANRMTKRIPGLLKLPRIAIEPPNPPLPKIRQPHFEEGMSTFEAGIQALSPFNSPEMMAQLTKNFLIWLDRARQNSGIKVPLKAGESFREARRRQFGQSD